MKLSFFMILALLLLGFCKQSLAQVVFQPQGCAFRAVFVGAPDIKTATMMDEQGHPQSETIASLGVILDGKPNFFRAECMNVAVPDTLDQNLLLEDMNTLARGNNLKNATVWVERSSPDELVGRVRGSFSDSVATYQLDIHRYFSRQNVFDVWIGSPPDIFPSEGNLIFLKELRRDGKMLN